MILTLFAGSNDWVQSSSNSKCERSSIKRSVHFLCSTISRIVWFVITKGQNRNRRRSRNWFDLACKSMKKRMLFETLSHRKSVNDGGSIKFSFSNDAEKSRASESTAHICQRYVHRRVFLVSMAGHRKTTTLEITCNILWGVDFSQRSQSTTKCSIGYKSDDASELLKHFCKFVGLVLIVAVV